MLKTCLATAVAMTALGSAVFAEPYVDYTPKKGFTHVQFIKVDPNHLDDYIVGLKKTWVPGEEAAKRHGVIDYYGIDVKLNGADGGANVALIEHVVSAAMLDPDKARDQAVEKESFAAMPKDQMDAKVKDFDKYRTFVGDDYYTELDLGH